MLRPNNNQLYSDYVSLLIPREYLEYYLQYIAYIVSFNRISELLEKRNSSFQSSLVKNILPNTAKVYLYRIIF